MIYGFVKQSGGHAKIYSEPGKGTTVRLYFPRSHRAEELPDAATAMNPRLKILFTSGYSKNAIVHHGRLIPGAHLLSKPYRLSDLAIKVDRVLNG